MRAWRHIVIVLLACLPMASFAADDTEELAERDIALIDELLAGMPAQRPGVPDLYVVGFAGDGNENVFRNEVAYLETLMSERYGTAGRTIALVNHPDSLARTPRPLATLQNLRHALTGIGAAMDPDEDLLLLYITTHGSPKFELSVAMPGHFDTSIKPTALRKALDAAGIPARVVVVSACYSGGFVPALRDPDTIVMTAARRDRPSFGCGDSTPATYFGRALLVEGMNRDVGLVEAFEYARRQVKRREHAEDLLPSEPQLDIGEQALTRLQAWESTLTPTTVVPYPYD